MNDGASRTSPSAAPPRDASPGDAPSTAEETSPASEAETAERDGEGRRLHPLTILQQIVTSLPLLLALLIPFYTTGGDLQAWSNLVPVLIYGVVSLPLIVVRYLRFRYWVTPSEIVIRSGVFKTQHRSIPIERVQNVQVVRSLLPRLLGMAQAKVETAGSGSTEGSLEYVSAGEAERIRAAVRAFQRQQGVAPSPASGAAGEASGHAASRGAAGANAQAEERPGEELLYEMPLGRVLLSGMFRFSLALIAFAFAGFQYAGFDDPEEWVDIVRAGPLRSFSDTALASPFVAVFFAVVAICLLGWLTGIVLNVNRYYGFRLWREGPPESGRLHYRRGLLTVAEGTIPLAKVQAVILRTNPLMRLFGWFILEVQTMGVEGSNHRTAVPLARRDEVLALAQRIRPLALPDAFHRVSQLTIRRAAIRFSIALAILVGVAGLVGGLIVERFFWHGAYWGLLAWPLGLAWAYLRYRCMGYAPAEEGLLVRRGVLRQRIWLLPVEKQQVFYTTASFFQRRLGLKTLYLDTAGAGGLASAEVVDLPGAEADRRLRQLYARFHDHFESAPEDVPPRDTPPEDAGP